MKPFIIHPSPASHQDVKALEQRRFKAEKFFERGIHQADVARRLKVSRAAAYYWYTIWKKQGKDGLRRKRPGPKPRLTEKKIAQVKQALAKGPLAAGYDTNLWTLARVADVIHRKARVSCGERARGDPELLKGFLKASKLFKVIQVKVLSGL